MAHIEVSLRAKLLSAYRLAASKVARRDDCRRLFADLGTDGLETLQTSLFVAASSAPARRICAKDVAAFTTVGSPVVRVCREFSALATERAALLLIHEALHTAGMSERPVDPEALSARQISVLVARSCG